MPLLEAPVGLIEFHAWGWTGPVVVLLHAVASGPTALGGLASRIAEDGCRVLAPALSGYGRTARSAGHDVLEANMAIVHALIAHSGERAFLFGHSMGGLVAMRSAIRSAGVAGVAAYEPVAFGVLNPDLGPDASALAWDRSIAERLVEKVAAGDPETGVAAFVEAWGETAWARLPETIRAGIVRDAERIAKEVAAVSADRAPAEAYAGLASPVLLMRGDRSPAAARLIPERLQAACPCAKLVTLADAGHMAPALIPEQVAKAFNSWRRTLKAPGTGSP